MTFAIPTPTAQDIHTLMTQQKVDRTLASLMAWTKWRQNMCHQLQKDLKTGRDVREVMIEFLQVLKVSE